MTVSLLLLACCLGFAASMNGDGQNLAVPYVDGAYPNTLPGLGTSYKVVAQGPANAAVVSAGDTVTVHATGVGKSLTCISSCSLLYSLLHTVLFFSLLSSLTHSLLPHHPTTPPSVKQTGKKFWSTHDAGQSPFTYQAGVGKVIKGWDQGCLGMKQGESRKLLIPASEGYGERGFPAWGIPPGGTLDFTIEVLEIKKSGGAAAESGWQAGDNGLVDQQ